jgi:nitrate/nitrite-specific signal transduction histidine kinase
MTFAKELSIQLPEDSREEMMYVLREILMNAMEHGAAFNPEQVVEVTAVRTARSMVFYVRDPGAGFRGDSLTHAGLAIRLMILRPTLRSAKKTECAREDTAFFLREAQLTSCSTVRLVTRRCSSST